MFGGFTPNSDGQRISDSQLTGFQGVQRAQETGEIRRVMGVNDISEEELSAPITDKRKISME